MPRGSGRQRRESRGEEIWPTGIYLRLSREDGNDESYSIGNQRQWLLDYIGDHGDLELVREYVDDGISGTSEEERPGYQQALQDIRDGTVKCLLVKDLSRPFRNSADQTRFLEETRVRYGVRFISTRLPFVDTEKYPETLNMLSLGFQGMMNENHCRETSLKVRDAFDSKRRRGEFIGAFAPYGYAKDPQNKNRLVVDGEAAQVVCDIYRWFCGGMSKYGVTARLNELGVPNPAEYKRRKGMNYKNPHHKFGSSLWQQRTVYDILTNRVYAGDMVQGRQRVKSYKVHQRVAVPREEWYIVENTHEPVVERSRFELAQKLMERDTRAPAGVRKLHLFSGFVRCGDCGRAMHRRAANGYAYYHCRTYAQQSKGACTKRSVREDLLYGAVLEAVRRQVDLLGSRSGLMEKVREGAAGSKVENRIKAILEQRREELDRKRRHARRLYGDLTDGLLDRGEYLRYREEFRKEIELLEGQIARLRAEEQAGEKVEEAIPPNWEAFLQGEGPRELDRRLLAELVRHVLIHGDGGVEVAFDFANPCAAGETGKEGAPFCG